MLTFDSIGAAREAIMDYRADHFADLDERFRARFKELAASPSPVDQIVNMGEFLFANREDVPDEARKLGAGLIAFATTNAWHGLLENDRGNAIVANLRKLSGEIKSAPAAPEPAVGARIEPIVIPDVEAKPE